MPNIKVLIVEDEFSIALDIQVRLQKMDYQVTSIAHNYVQALQCVQAQPPNIVLMDINLSQGKSGIEAARDIYQQYRIPVVFLTAYGDDKTFAEALDSQPFGYLLKPFKDQELNFALKVALQKCQETPPPPQVLSDTLFIKDKSQFTAVKVTDILWVEAMDNYALIITKTQKVVANLFLKDIAQKLPNERFLRIHRSYIIALDKVEKIEDNAAQINQTMIPISKSYKHQLLTRLNVL
ncbi:response regulator [uncultured Microscilla sp.]|uniref:LytR/AlgR family response regulator transcription factor n=1 Tax=uncultured Microscilla sp. TaxID=432653 RepID=UPI0026067B28|nr:response regulator [uncultured Microscilla sp.]